MKKQKSSNKIALLWYEHPRLAIALMLIVVNLAVILLFAGIMAIIRQENFFGELS